MKSLKCCFKLFLRQVFKTQDSISAAMASFIESQAVLEARLKAAGFSDDVKDKFIAAGITCLSQLAFMSSYSPGANDESPLIDAFKDILARDPSIGEKANMRRVFNEAYASVTAEMRQNVERVEETTIRKLSQPERHDRYIKQVARLTGVSIKGATEPGDTLVDAFCSMYEDNRLRFIEWEKYVSKDQEMQAEGKKITSFAVDQGTGKLKIENKSPDEKADTSSDILMLQALTRRSLAMDQANLVSYTKMQSWVDKLVKCRTDEPPPGYSSPSMRQIMLADQKLFIELADRTRLGIQSTVAGRPLDDIIEVVMYLNEVTCMLQPLPKAKEASVVRDSGGEPYARVKGGGGKGKGKKGGKASRMPSDLVGCRSHTNSGSPICYGFNLKTCNEEVKSGRCSKGFHICAVPRCGKHHPAVDCPSFGSVKKS